MHEVRGRGKGQERGEREPGVAARRAKIQKEQITKISGLSMEEPLEKGSPAPQLESSGRGQGMSAVPCSRVLRNAGRTWRPGPL